ncbi:unnamed protein product [Acanthoscelides obtectus]|uniref:Uncharacterized protein n=1 Tax=Acanthoscelides obtectus TaxID=200917 RepID=A0A9P0P356_ACAOB|nr:unnamed protein product [Acanthoscelides obtectus]CAK1653452.1 hypothetical protein AOBTE_LOCUS18238 [Acanthoscelides obtectus]
MQYDSEEHVTFRIDKTERILENSEVRVKLSDSNFRHKPGADGPTGAPDNCDDPENSDINIEIDLPEVRSRRVKKMRGEGSSDERSENKNDRYKIETFNIVDTIVHSMANRFQKNFEICKDFSMLDTKNFSDIKDSLN